MFVHLVNGKSLFSSFLRKIHNIVTFSTKLQEHYFFFEVLTQYWQFLFVKYLELNSLQGKGWEREIHRGGPWGQPQHPQCEGRCTDLEICGVVNKLNIRYMRHDDVYLDTLEQAFLCYVLEGTSCILFVWQPWIISFKCMAMPSRNILVSIRMCATGYSYIHVLLYSFTTHVLLIKLLLWDSWQIPPKHRYHLILTMPVSFIVPNRSIRLSLTLFIINVYTINSCILHLGYNC